MSDDPFTLDLFGSSALSSGLGISAFGGFAPEAANDDEPDPTPPFPPAVLPSTQSKARKRGDGASFYLQGDRGLAATWKERAQMNVAAILLASEIERQDRPARPDEQARLIRYAGFGASELANRVFRRPGEAEFREGWEALGSSLETSVSEGDYASLARSTQYAHFTPEFIVRAMWAGLKRLGWRGGRVLEPGIGTGLFPTLIPEDLRGRSFVTGIELDPVTARIARLLQPKARIITGDFARTDLAPIYDLAIGNPPFSDRTVRSDRPYRSLGLRLHDYFIARSIDLLKPGALAAFVTSSGTLDKADNTAREHIARSSDLIAAIRLPEGSFRRDAGTDVVVDILFFRKRKIGEAEGDQTWLELDEIQPATADKGSIRVNRWLVKHPDSVLGAHALTSGPYGETYTCQPRADVDLKTVLDGAITKLPGGLYDGEPTEIDIDLQLELGEIVDLKSDRARIREGSFLVDSRLGLMQVIEGVPLAIVARKGRSSDGVSEKHIRILKKLIPIRDAVREVLKAQEADRPWRDSQVKLRIAWSSFVRDFGPINHTKVSVIEDPETGETRETHRRPNLQPFLDDPDCWLVASIEDYDLETDTAKPGPIFSERVIAPPAPPIITSAADALAVVLNERGRVDLEHIAELLHRDTEYRYLSITFDFQPAYELSPIQHTLPYRLDRSTEIRTEDIVGVRGARTLAFQMIGHSNLNDRGATLREKIGNLAVPCRRIPMVKNYHRMFERAAFCDLRPNNVILFDVSGNIRRKFEVLAVPLKIFKTSSRFTEKGGIGDSLVRKGTKLFETCNPLRVWEGTFRVKQET